MAVISELKTRSKNLCQKFYTSYPSEADMEEIKFPIKANTLYSINFNTTKEAYKTIWLYDNSGNITKKVSYAYAPQAYDKMVVFSENNVYMSIGVINEAAKVMVAEGLYFTLNTTQQNNLNNNKITTSVSGGELPYEPYYVDITKYNNEIISNINHNSKNLFDINSVELKNCEIIDNGIKFNGSGSFDIKLPAGTYTMSFKNNGVAPCFVRNGKVDSGYISQIQETSTSTTFNFTGDVDGYLRISCFIAGQILSDIQIENGTIATAYKPYTIQGLPIGDYHFAKQNEDYGVCENAVEEPIIDMKISGNSVQDGIPTPETPIEIESVGDKTSNIFSTYGVSATLPQTPSANRVLTNAYGTTINSIDFTGEIIATQTQYPNQSSFIDYRNGFFSMGVNGLEVGKKYTLIYEYEVLENPLNNENTNAIMINGGFGTYAEQSGNRLKYVFSWKKPEGYETREYIEIRLSGRSMKFKNFMILEGEVDGFPEYEPYGYKVPVNVSGKNLIDYAHFSTYSNWNKDLVTSGSTTTNSSNYGYLLPAEVGKTYTLSYKANSVEVFPTFLYLCKAVNGEGSLVVYLTTSKIFRETYTFTVNENEIYFLRMGSTGNQSGFDGQLEKLKYIQLEEGSTTTAYEPYLNKTTNIYLNEPLRKIGDYADYIDYKNKKVVRNFNTIKLNDLPLTYYKEGIFYALVSDISHVNVDNSQPANIMSNIYNASSYTNLLTYKTDRVCAVNKDWARIYIRDTSYSDVTTLKEALGENYFIYELAKPTEETIDIPEISTNKGTNNFVVETKILPSEIKINYWKQIGLGEDEEQIIQKGSNLLIIKTGADITQSGSNLTIGE